MFATGLYANGKLNGKHIEYYQSGGVYQIINYKDGIEV